MLGSWFAGQLTVPFDRFSPIVSDVDRLAWPGVRSPARPSSASLVRIGRPVGRSGKPLEPGDRNGSESDLRGNAGCLAVVRNRTGGDAGGRAATGR
jgi:hypothetical protein